MTISTAETMAMRRYSMDGWLSADAVTATPATDSSWNGVRQPSERIHYSHSSAGRLSNKTSFTLTNGNSAIESNSVAFPELEGKGHTEQIETLREMLEKAIRIKEGAENLLRMDLPDATRADVEEELKRAVQGMNTIQKKLESFARGPRKGSIDSKSHSPLMAMRKLAADSNSHRSRDNHVDREEFKSAKQHVLTHMKRLATYARHQPSAGNLSQASTSESVPLPSTDEELEKARMEIMSHLVAILQKTPRVRFEINMEEVVEAVTPALADKCSTKSRATAYRLLRHIICDLESIERLFDGHLEWYIVKSLARENKHAVEREQVIKLIRAVVDVGSERRAPHTSAGLGKVPLPESVMRALISIAEHAEDPFRQICCETLVEILLIDIDLMFHCGGLRILLQALAEGPVELAPTIVTAFLYVVDAPRTRLYFNPGTDLEIALSGVTDAYGRGTSYIERMRGCTKVISVILRSWSGLMYFCISDMLPIRAIINMLKIPTLETREVILDLFFELLDIDTPEWFQTFIDGRRLTMCRKSRPPSHLPQKDKEHKSKPIAQLTIADQYISLLLLILTKAGLLEALTTMLEETTTGSTLSRKATLLLAELLQMCNKVLPFSFASKIQSIPRIFELAVDYHASDHRVVGATALSAIDSFNRHRSRSQPISVKDSRQRANSIEDPVRRGQRQVEQVKMKLAMQMDDRTFQASIIETQVMIARDYTKWNFDILQDLIEGPLLNPKRLEESIKLKFMKRLLSFFHPFSHRFSEIRKQKANLKWIKLGCSILTTLLANSDGIRFLGTEDELLPQISKAFTQLASINGQSDGDIIFTKRRMEDTLTSGYLEMLGILTKQKEGIDLLEKFGIFTALYHLADLRGREDLVKAVVDNLDYSLDGHPRIVLSKTLTSNYKHVRLYATKHLGQLIQASPKTNPWMLRLLLTQLYDPDLEVCGMAVKFLEDACDLPDVLKIVVDMQPTLEHLGEVVNSLMYKFMATPVGFRYLYDIGFIEREMDTWLHERNFDYVVEVEVYLSKELNYNRSEGDSEYDALNLECTIPPHFYGELAKTELGCQVLQEKGHFVEFARFLRVHGLESEDFEIIHKLKSVLWAIGNIASTEGGLHLLEEGDLVPVLVEIAEQSPVLSVRGTCFYALGLVSSTVQGAEVLDDCNWEAALSPLGHPTGLCVPVDVDKFIHIQPWEDPNSLTRKPQFLKPPTSEEEAEVLLAITNLANTVIANAASRSLAKMRSKPEYQPVFTSPSFFYRVLYLISTHRFRLPVRRYILELFDIQLDTDVIKVLAECSKTLRDSTPSSTSPKVTKAQPRVVSVFGGARGPRRATESDDDDDDSLDGHENNEKKVVQRPVSLLPVKRITGFLDETPEE